MDFEGCLSDASFGPFVKGCRGNFDFTLKFEVIIFFIAPSCVFTALAFVRILILVSKSQIITGNRIPLSVIKNVYPPISALEMNCWLIITNFRLLTLFTSLCASLSLF